MHIFIQLFQILALSKRTYKVADWFPEANDKTYSFWDWKVPLLLFQGHYICLTFHCKIFFPKIQLQQDFEWWNMALCTSLLRVKNRKLRVRKWKIWFINIFVIYNLLLVLVKMTASVSELLIMSYRNIFLLKIPMIRFNQANYIFSSWKKEDVFSISPHLYFNSGFPLHFPFADHSDGKK